MRFKKLKIVGLRALTQIELEFQPGMNLLVGVNGVGKTTVLDALRFSISRALLPITMSQGPKVPFEDSDMRIGADSTQIECKFEFQGKEFELLLLKQRHQFVEGKEGEVREQVKERPDREDFIPPDITRLFPGSKDSSQQPICVYFSVRRSLQTTRQPSSLSTAGGQAAAFAEALNSRDFNIREIAEWMHTQKVLGEEDPRASRHVGAMTYAAEVFLPEYKNLHEIPHKGGWTLQIEKNGIPLNVDQLSEGERGVLCLVLDLAKRLSQANPGLDNPIEAGEGIVLIDELDLHLHPKWQRTIVENLTKTFPKCQFIATTHSPQIIPSIDPESVLVMKDGKVDSVNRSLGMDSNWILKFLMETEDRPHESVVAIQKVEDLILAGNFTAARQVISEYRQKDFDLEEWAMFEARIARIEILKK